MNSAWVPLPAPGGPTRTTRTRTASSFIGLISLRISWIALTQEPFVVTLHQLALNLFHSVQSHADHDQHCGPAEREVLVVAAGHRKEEVRQDRHDAEIQGPRQRDPRQYELQVLGSRAAGPDTRNEPAVLLHVISTFLGVKRDADVEIGKEDDQYEVDRDVHPRLLVDQIVVHPALEAAAVAGLQLAYQLRDVQQRRGEDDRYDTGLVHLQRQVRR